MQPGMIYLDAGKGKDEGQNGTIVDGDSFFQYRDSHYSRNLGLLALTLKPDYFMT